MRFVLIFTLFFCCTIGHNSQSSLKTFCGSKGGSFSKMSSAICSIRLHWFYSYWWTTHSEFDFNSVLFISFSLNRPMPPPSLQHTPRFCCSLYSELSLVGIVDSGASAQTNYSILLCVWAPRLFFWTAPWLVETFACSIPTNIFLLALYYFRGCSLHKWYSFDYFLWFSYFTSISS